MPDKKRRVRSTVEPQMGMTSMIDVVFLILVFFVVTFEPMDVLGKLPFDRPQDSDTPGEPPPAFTLTVTETGYLANGKRLSLDRVDRYLKKMSTNFGMDSLLIICHDESQHTKLIQALDICAKNDITNISVMSR
jgi:biopolymer transport protein ExbD